MTVALVNNIKTDPKNFQESTQEYVYLKKIINFFQSSGGIDNLNQALAIIKNYNISNFKDTEKKEIVELSKKIEAKKDEIIRSISKFGSSPAK